MTLIVHSNNAVVERRELAFRSQRSHGLAVAEGLLAHRVGFLVFLHDNVGVVLHTLLEPPSKVHDDGKGEEDEKGELPALSNHHSFVNQYVNEANDRTGDHGRHEPNHRSKVWTQTCDKTRRLFGEPLA